MTVVVPVYNTQEYLRECLSSLTAQSHVAIEVIVVDDGSEDSSLLIAEEFAKKDTRFQIMRQSNQGLSSARNAGLSRASGEYVLFLDSDDLLNPQSLAKVYRQAHRLGSDLHFFRADLVLERGGDVVSGGPIRSLMVPEKAIDGLSALSYSARFGTWQPSATFYLIRRRFLVDSGVLFHPGIYFEDNPFTLGVLLRATRVSSSAEVALLVRKRPGSITRRPPGEKHVWSLEECWRLISEDVRNMPLGLRLRALFAVAYVQRNVLSQLIEIRRHFRRNQSPEIASPRSEWQFVSKGAVFAFRVALLSLMVTPFRITARMVRNSSRL